MRKQKSETIYILIGVLALLGIILMVGTITFASAYTVPVSDDFWHAKYTGIKQTDLWPRIKASWDYVVYNFIYHQGAYSIFFCSFFNPLTSDLFPSLRTFMVVNAVNYFASVILLVTVMFKSVTKKNTPMLLLLIFLVLFPITQYDAFQETFYWFTGCTNYSWPMSFANYLFVSMILLNRTKEKKLQNLFTVTGCIFGFLLEGGVLSIGGTICTLIFLFIIYYRMKTGHFNSRNWIILGVTLGFGIVNLISPGNYIRRTTETDGAMDFLKSLLDTGAVSGASYEWYFITKNYFFIMILLLICGIVLAKEIRIYTKGYVICTLLSLPVPLLTIFPVCFGYNVAWMPNRCIFIMAATMSFVYGNFAFMLGYLLGGKLSRDKMRIVVPVLCIAAVIQFAAFPYGIRDMIIAKLDKQLYTGEIQEWYVDTKEMIEGFSDLKGQDVVVDVPTYPEALRNFYCFFVLEGEDNMVNQGVAWAFDLNTIRSSRQDGD